MAYGSIAAFQDISKPAGVNLGYTPTPRQAAWGFCFDLGSAHGFLDRRLVGSESSAGHLLGLS